MSNRPEPLYKQAKVALGSFRSEGPTVQPAECKLTDTNTDVTENIASSANTGSNKDEGHHLCTYPHKQSHIDFECQMK